MPANFCKILSLLIPKYTSRKKKRLMEINAKKSIHWKEKDGHVNEKKRN